MTDEIHIEEQIAAVRKAFIGMIGRSDFPAIEAALATLEASRWQPIETAPKDRTYIILAGPSGYTTTTFRAKIGRGWTTYRENRWINHSDDDFTDGGKPPTHWHPSPFPAAE